MNDVDAAPRRRFLARAVGRGVGAGRSPAATACRAPSGFPKVLGVGRAVERRACAQPSRRARRWRRSSPEPIARRRFAATARRIPDTDEYHALARQRLRRLSRWPSTAWSAQPRELLAGRAARAAVAHADHAPRLRRRLERDRQVEGRAAVGAARGGAAASRARATSCSTAPTRWRQDGTDLYYESIDIDDAYHRADDPRVRAERRAAAGRERRAAAAARRAAAGLQAREVRDGASSWSTASRNIAGGKGGYWEDQGYQWYAGI